MRKLLLLILFPLVAFSQRVPAGWNDPFPPHHIMDNVYYVGTKELASFLIVTPQGNILMNSNYESSVTGGSGNTASGFHASVSGGNGNTASGDQAAILGGNGITVSTTNGTSP